MSELRSIRKLVAIEEAEYVNQHSIWSVKGGVN